MTGALANKHCLNEMDEEILPRSRITNQKLEDDREGSRTMMQDACMYSLKSGLRGSWGQCLCLLYISLQGDFPQPPPSSELLELTDGAFKARAIGPRINFCSWNLLDVGEAGERREPVRLGGRRRREEGARRERSRGVAELLACLGTPAPHRHEKFLL